MTLEEQIEQKLSILLPFIEAEIDRVNNMVKNGAQHTIALCEAAGFSPKKMKKLKESVAAEKWTDADDMFDRWLALTMGTKKYWDFTEEELRRIRDVSRIMCGSDETAKNILAHIKNLVVGSGITCVITPKDLGADPAKIADTLDKDTNLKLLETNWTAFEKANKFYKMQLNWIERKHRDGECILELFKTGAVYGKLKVPALRFVDPNYITGTDVNANQKLGVKYKKGDEQTIVSLHYEDDAGEDRTISIEDCIFDKANVDFETLRGIGSFFPILTNLRRISKNLVNVSVLTSVLSCIALVRKHTTSSQAKIVSFLNRNSDGKNRTEPVSGASKPAKAIDAGTVIDAPMGVEYDFPAHKVATKNFLEVIDAEIGRIAALFNLPDSWVMAKEVETDITESSPVAKRWKREQQEFFCEHETLFWMVQERMGVNPDLREQYSIQFYGPDITAGSAIDEARVNEIEMRSGTLSPQTWAARRGRNWAVERAYMIKHRRTAQPGEVMPGDAGNTNVTGDETAAGQGGDGTTKKGGGQRGGAAAKPEPKN